MEVFMPQRMWLLSSNPVSPLTLVVGRLVEVCVCVGEQWASVRGDRVGPQSAEEKTTTSTVYCLAVSSELWEVVADGRRSSGYGNIRRMKW